MTGAVVWLTGLPGSGKSTLAERVRAALSVPSVILDGDVVRKVLVPPHGYDPAGREAFYASLAGLAAVLADQGLVVLVAATAHRRVYRERARALAPRFLEVHVATSAEECAARDPKRLYADARAGAIRGLPGAGASYEPPEAPDVIARGGEDREAVAAIVARLTNIVRPGA